MSEYPLPLFNGDREESEGMPEAGQLLKALFREHDGLIIASPEYNSTFTAALKNSIDWVSRANSEDEEPLAVLRGKMAAILSASPGGYGGSRSLGQLRPFLENIAITVLESQVSVPKAHEAFDERDQLNDPILQEAVRKLGAELADRLK